MSIKKYLIFYLQLAAANACEKTTEEAPKVPDEPKQTEEVPPVVAEAPPTKEAKVEEQSSEVVEKDAVEENEKDEVADLAEGLDKVEVGIISL